jgi:hypothetical protein
MADLTITAANVATAGRQETGTFGATITAGQVVFKDSSTKKFELADADDTSLDEVYGIALNGGADGQPGVVALPGSDITIGATLTAGTAYYLSATAGGICPFADLVTGDRVIFLGIAKSTSVLHFRPIDSGVIL